jgi:hypothetical protein
MTYRQRLEQGDAHDSVAAAPVHELERRLLLTNELDHHRLSGRRQLDRDRIFDAARMPTTRVPLSCDASRRKFQSRASAGGPRASCRRSAH